MRNLNWWPSALSAAVVILCGLAAPAFADDCGPLQQAASVDLTMTPNGLPMVPVTLNGSPRKFLFGTAGSISTITQAAADSLNLSAVSSRVRLLSTNGNASSRFVSVASFVYGGLQGKDLEFLISPDSNLGSPNLPVDGELAGDIMKRYDTEMDFAGGKLSYFLPDHCDGHVVHWTTAPASVVPFRRTQPGIRNPNDTDIRFHVTLDGKDLLAVLNTAGGRSQMSARTADTYDVNEDTMGTVPLGTMAGHKVFSYAFKTIAFGDVTVNNPRVVILPDVVGRNDPNNAGRTDSRIKKEDDDLEPDLSIGMDVIRQLHIYVATKEEKLYITAAGPPAATQVAAIPAPAASASASQAPAAQSSDVCLSGWPTLPGSGPGGVVMSFYDQATALNMIQVTQAQNHGKIDPDYVDNLRVQLRLPNGKPLVALVPKSMTVHVGDHVTFQGGYRVANLPCNYIPSLLTADLGNAPSSGTGMPPQQPQAGN
jgi:hypothetical protein